MYDTIILMVVADMEEEEEEEEEEECIGYFFNDYSIWFCFIDAEYNVQLLKISITTC